MTIDELVQARAKRTIPGCVSADVEVVGFSTFFARYGDYQIGNEIKPDVFVIARIEVVLKDRGAFTRFLRSIAHKFSYIAIESVLVARFADFLLREGFTFTSPNVWWRKRDP